MSLSLLITLWSLARASSVPSTPSSSCLEALDPHARVDRQLRLLMPAAKLDVSNATERLTWKGSHYGWSVVDYRPFNLEPIGAREQPTLPSKRGLRLQLGLIRDSGALIKQFVEFPTLFLRTVPEEDRALWSRYLLTINPLARLSANGLASISRELFWGDGPLRDMISSPESSAERRYLTFETLLEFLEDHWDGQSRGDFPHLEELAAFVLRAATGEAGKFEERLAKDYLAGHVDAHPRAVRFLAHHLKIYEFVKLVTDDEMGAVERPRALLQERTRPFEGPTLRVSMQTQLLDAMLSANLSEPRKSLLVEAIRRTKECEYLSGGPLLAFIRKVSFREALACFVKSETDAASLSTMLISALLERSTESHATFREFASLLASDTRSVASMDDEVRARIKNRLEYMLVSSTDEDWDRWAVDLFWKLRLRIDGSSFLTLAKTFRQKHAETWARDFILRFFAQDHDFDLSEFLIASEFKNALPPMDVLDRWIDRASSDEYLRSALVKAVGALLIREPGAKRPRLETYARRLRELDEQRPNHLARELVLGQMTINPTHLTDLVHHQSRAEASIEIASAASGLRNSLPVGCSSWMEFATTLAPRTRYDLVLGLLGQHDASTAAVTDLVRSLEPIDGVREAVRDYFIQTPKIRPPDPQFRSPQGQAMFSGDRLRVFFPHVSPGAEIGRDAARTTLLLAVLSAAERGVDKNWLVDQLADDDDSKGVGSVLGFVPAFSYPNFYEQVKTRLSRNGVPRADQMRGLIVQGNYERRGHSIMREATRRGNSQVEEDAIFLNLFMNFLLGYDFPENRPLVKKLFATTWSINSDPPLIASMRRRAALIAIAAPRDFWNLRVEIHNFPNQDTLNRVREYHRRLSRFHPLRSQFEILIAEIEKVLNSTRRTPGQLGATIDRLPGPVELRQKLKVEFGTTSPQPIAARLASLASLRRTWSRDRQTRDHRSEQIDTLLGDQILSDHVQGEIAREIETLEFPANEFGVNDFAQLMKGIFDHLVLDDLIDAKQGESLNGMTDELLVAAELNPKQKVESLVRVIQSGIDLSHRTLEEEFGRFDRIYNRVVPRGDHAPEPFVDDVLRGSNVLMLSRLAERVRGPVEVFNAGSIVGTLRLHPDLTRLEATDIPLFDTLPPQIEPVAGLLTLAVGSRLSHLQLLARSLGIPNVRIDRNFRDSIAHLDGQRVVLTATAQGGLDVHAAAEDHISSEARPAVVVPRPDRTLDRPILLSRAGRSTHTGFAGPKSLNLARLMTDPELAGSVPNGVILPFGFFNRFVGAAHLRPLLRTLRLLNVENRALVDRVAYLIRQRIEETPIPPEMLNELTGELEGLNLPLTTGLFVRSDTNVEDLEDFNGAGLNESVPNVGPNHDALDRAIRRVWSSVFTERAILWRAKAVRSALLVMAEPSVLIQPTVEAESSGVVTSRGTDAWQLGRGLISADRGIAAVVEAEGAVEEWTLAGGVPRRLSASLSSRWNATSLGGGLRQVDARPGQAVLTPEQAERLGATAVEIERVLGSRPHGWDIEWAFENGVVRILQARPNF